MRRVSLYRIFFLLYGVTLVLFPVSVQGESFSIVIQEVQIAGETSDDEFIELYNPTDTPVDISSWQLRRKTESGSVSSIKVFAKDTLVAPYSYYLWANSKGAFASLADTTTSSSALANNNSIALYTKSGSDGILVDSLTWGTGALFRENDTAQVTPLKNESLYQESVGSWSIKKPSMPDNSHTLPTTLPSLPTAPALPTPPAESPLNTTVTINELLPNPLPSEEEFIELYNNSAEAVSLSGWTLHDASKNGKYTFPKDTTIASDSFLVIPKSLFHFALNNSNEILTLRDSKERTVDTITYPKSIAGVSLNKSIPSFRGGTPTPGKENILNELPTTRERVPESGFPDIALSFNARGKDKEDASLKYVWDFGDGHKSYKEKTTHKYQDTGTYTVTLITKDSKDSTVETFLLTIKKYTPPKLRIVAFSPNPEGADTGKEWVDIQNKSKKEVDLQGFSLATGTKSKKLTNHPIHDSVTIEPGETLRLTRKHVLFSLPNTKGSLELRAPNGDVVDKFRYREDKAITENAVYQKEKDKTWTVSQDPAVLGVTDETADSTEDTSTFTSEVVTTPEYSPLEKEQIYSKLESLFTT
ncbi:MAG: lamin tail domain-containing protein, partial [Patescibacteria group bacterium]